MRVGTRGVGVVLSERVRGEREHLQRAAELDVLVNLRDVCEHTISHVTYTRYSTVLSSDENANVNVLARLMRLLYGLRHKQMMMIESKSEKRSK